MYTDEKLQLSQGFCFPMQAMLPGGFPFHQFNLSLVHHKGCRGITFLKYARYVLKLNKPHFNKTLDFYSTLGTL